MSYEFFIGLRYLRSKRQPTFVSVITFISILGITVGVMALIIVLSVMSGFEKDIRDKILGINAHIVVLKYGNIKEYRELTEKLKDVEEVRATTPFVYRQAMLSSPYGAAGVVIRGIELESFEEVTELSKKMTQGGLEGLKEGFKEAAQKGELPGIVIGGELAKTLGLWVGDKVNLITVLEDEGIVAGTPRIAKFKVVGIFDVGMYDYDSGLAFISLKNAQRLFRMGDSVTGIEVKIEDIYRADVVKDRITEAIGKGYKPVTWMEMNRNLFSALRLEKTAMFIILTLIILVAALNIISTLIMVVMEKGKEIAILKSMGATSSGIMRIFMIQGTVIGMVGTFLGTVLGVVCALNLEPIVASIERLFDFKLLPPSVYYIDRLPSEVEPSVVAVIVVVSLLISFLATLYPSWKASRFDPVEGLRYE